MATRTNFVTAVGAVGAVALGFAVGRFTSGGSKPSVRDSPAAASRQQIKPQSPKPESKVNLTLESELQNKLSEYRASRKFNAEAWIEKRCNQFNDYMRKCGLKACVVSLSGGVDSAVTLGLMKRASEMKDSPIQRVIAINQPIHSSAWAYNRAKECAMAFRAEFVTVDQSNVYDSLKNLVDSSVGVEGRSFASGQLRSYMRTPVGYYVAQLISQSGLPCIVMGTGNQDEDGYLAYFCKAGDGVVDVQLISDIHKHEVFMVGDALGVPGSILNAAPSADLWQGQTDEEELGFSYDFIELFTGMYLKLEPSEQQAFKESLSPRALAQFDSWCAKAIAVHNRNKHKLNSPVNITSSM